MDEIEIVELKQKHCPQVALIENETFSFPWSEQSFLECVGIEYGKSDNRKKFLLEVRCGNKAAISLYKKLGFKEDGIRPEFYDEPKEDALLMSLEI